MKKFNFKKILSIIVFIFVAVFFVFYLKNNWRDFSSIHIVSWWYLSGFIILTLISFFITALFFQKSVEPFSLKLTFNEYFGLTMITMMGNYLIPFSGLGFRAIYMRKVYNFSYQNFITTVIANWITNFLIYSAAGIFALILFLLRSGDINWPLMSIFIVFIIISLLTFIPVNPNKKYSKLFNRIILPLIDWQEYLKNKTVIQQLLVLTFWQFIVATLAFYFAFLTFNFKITFFESFLPTILSLYSAVIRLVPASFGLYEASIVYPAKIIGFSVANGLAVSALTRVVSMFLTFVLALWFSYILSRKIKNKN